MQNFEHNNCAFDQLQMFREHGLSVPPLQRNNIVFCVVKILRKKLPLPLLSISKSMSTQVDPKTPQRKEQGVVTGKRMQKFCDSCNYINTIK